jgi:hypothetical protein
MGGSATLRALIREYLFVSLFRACAESLASENASRLAAMERADRNIDELLEDLNGNFHRLRQSGIDAELFDVISGFEALGSPRRKSVSRKELSSSIRLVKRAYQKHGISMPDEAREVVFPQGIPITMLDGKPASPPIVQVKLQIPGERSSEEAGVVSTKAEGGLQSEAGVLDEQARQAQPVREGENLLPNAPATIASEEPPPKPPKESGPSRTSQ